MHCALAGVVDICLIPEVNFNLDGGHGLMAYIETLLANKGHCVICVAEGAGQVTAAINFCVFGVTWFMFILAIFIWFTIILAVLPGSRLYLPLLPGSHLYLPLLPGSRLYLPLWLLSLPVDVMGLYICCTKTLQT